MECLAERWHFPRNVEKKKALTGSDSSERDLLVDGMLTRTSLFAKGISAGPIEGSVSSSLVARRRETPSLLPCSIELHLKSGISEVGSCIGCIAEKPDAIRFHELLFERPVANPLAGAPMPSHGNRVAAAASTAAAIGLTSSSGRPSWQGRPSWRERLRAWRRPSSVLLS